MKLLKKILLRGLFAVLPLVVTIALVYWLLSTAERMLGGAIAWAWPEVYFTGLGLIVGLLLVVALGMVLQLWLAQQLWQLFERLLKRVPLLKTLYGSIQDLLSLFSGDQKQDFNKVVTLRWGGQRVLGFVTREDFGDVPAGVGGEEDVCVYVPMGYQLGGFTFVVNRSDLQQVKDMTLEEAMKFAITAGVTMEREQKRGAAQG